MSRVRRADKGWVVAALICLVAIAPLTAPAFFLNAHDATIGAYFLMQFDHGMAGGELYPRWAMDWTFGYGYPLFVVIAPLAFYVAQAFHLLGAGLVDALKLTFALGLLLSGLSMYLLGRQLFGRAGGLVATALYVYAPFHLVDVYVRADLAEAFAYVFFPAILWALWRLSRARGRSDVLRFIALGGLLYGGLILTHITMAMIFTPIALAYVLALAVRRQQGAESRAQGAESGRLGAASGEQHAGSSAGQARDGVPESPSAGRYIVTSLGMMVLGLAISAAYLLPGVLELHYLSGSDLLGGYFGYANHYVYPFQLLSPLWGYGYAAIGPSDQMSFQLGIVAAVLAVCSLWALQRMSDEVRRQAAFFLAVSGLVIFSMLAASRPWWDFLQPLVAFIQFPWRLLALTSLSLALVGGALAVTFTEQPDMADRAAPKPANSSTGTGAGAAPGGATQAEPRPLAGVLILLAVLASAAYTVPQYTGQDVSLAKMLQFQLDTKELLGDTIWVTERPTGSPMVADYLAGQPPERAVAADPAAQVETLPAGGQSYAVQVTAPNATDVLFRIRYFPGWTAYVDGQPLETQITPPQGLMTVSVPAGEHTIELRFEDTPLRRLSKLISLLGLTTAIVLLVAAARINEDAAQPTGEHP